MVEDNNMVTKEELEKMSDDEETHYPDITTVPKSDADKNYRMPGEKEPVMEASGPIQDSKLETDEMKIQAAYFKSLEPPHPTPPIVDPIKEEPEEVENVDEGVADEGVADETKQEEEDVTKPVKNVDQDLAVILDTINGRIDAIDQTTKTIKQQNDEKDGQIEALARANIELMLVDMQTIADDLNYVDELIDEIGTEEQFEKIYYEEKNRGLNMAYMAAKRFIEENGSNARQIKPITQALRLTLNRLNEKLKYTEDY